MATITGSGVLVGTAGNDAITGDTTNDVLVGHGGSDTLNGGDGDDILAPDTSIYLISDGVSVTMRNVTGHRPTMEPSITSTAAAGSTASP